MTHAGTQPDASDFPVTVTDGNGDEVTITEPPAKIASLDAAHTEMLYAIGAGDQVSAVDNTSNCPAQVSASSARVDAFNASLEAITGLEPDLVIARLRHRRTSSAAMRGAGLDGAVPALARRSRRVHTTTSSWSARRPAIPTRPARLSTSMIARGRMRSRRSVAGEDAPTVYHEVDNTYYSVGPGQLHR